MHAVAEASTIDALLDVYNTLPSDERVASQRMADDDLVRYLEMRLGGQSHKFAEMMATRSFPAIRTDSEYNKGRCNGNQFEAVPGLGNLLRKQAEAAGVSTTGKYYCHGLAEYPGDPEAWVGGRGDVLAVAKKKGMSVQGSVEYTHPERAPMADVEIADDLIQREVEQVMARDGGYRRGDVEENVRMLRSGAVDINGLLCREPGGCDDAAE
jgi:hypothetical protein